MGYECEMEWKNKLVNEWEMSDNIYPHFTFHQVYIRHHWAENTPFQNCHISGWHVACMCLGHVTLILIHQHVPLLVQLSSKLLFPEGIWFTDFELSICNTSSTGTLQWLAKHARWPMSGVTLSPVSNTDQYCYLDNQFDLLLKKWSHSPSSIGYSLNWRGNWFQTHSDLIWISGGRQTWWWHIITIGY